MPPLSSLNDAFTLLNELGAPTRLIRHLELVSEAADLLMREYERLGVPFERRRIELGAALHDAGKILHPAELDGPGSLHEPAGRELLIAHGVPAEIAACCVTHAQWAAPGRTFEELSVALSDKLWKGKREADLELLVIDAAAKRLAVDRWAVFSDLDAAFEGIAASGDDRLGRSRI